MSEITQFLSDLATVGLIVGVCITLGVVANVYWGR